MIWFWVVYTTYYNNILFVFNPDNDKMATLSDIQKIN